MIRGIGINGVPDISKRRCFDCDFCQSSVSLWCTNAEASKYRGTSIPGIKDCHFWKPIITVEEWYENSSFLQRIFGYGSNFIEVDLSNNPKREEQ